MNAASIREVLVAGAQKTLLALDGGEIESLLADHLSAQRSGSGTFVLADYFDFVGGTSTGAIIAAGLSLGWSIDRLKGLYSSLGGRRF
jgi:patatin-like phospholipase/acyl hydrolase